MDHFALIVAGGRGLRMGSEIPKQFLHLSGKPVLMHSILAFRKFEPGIPVMVVLPEDQVDFWQDQCRKHRFSEEHDITTGGDTRFQSVKNGLDQIEGEGLIAIHDGVRPLIFPEVISRLFDEAAIHSNAIPAVTSTNSLRWQDEKGNHIIDRSFIKIIQTPQIFELNKLRKAYVQSFECSFTDDAAVWEKAGYHVHLARGQETNIKITNPEDLPMAQALMNSLDPDA